MTTIVHRVPVIAEDDAGIGLDPATRQASAIGSAAAMATLSFTSLSSPADLRRGMVAGPAPGLAPCDTIRLTATHWNRRVVDQRPSSLTPGPLTTSLATKQAMLRDWGSWIPHSTQSRRASAGCRRHRQRRQHQSCVPLQGSGTFSVAPRSGPRWSKNNRDAGAGERRPLPAYRAHPVYLGRSCVTMGHRIFPTPQQIDDALAADRRSRMSRNCIAKPEQGS